MKLIEINPIILASKSPRRLDILNAHGIQPVVCPSDADETLTENLSPEEAVSYLAGVKAAACAELPEIEARTEGIIIAADTIVWKDGIMGKPENREDAFRMLSAIRNTSHSVLTGVALIDLRDRRQIQFAETTTVWCKDYSDWDIYDYIDREQPYDKAGSYAIQSGWSKHIDHIEGDYENVVGLPYARLAKEVEEFYL